MNKSRFNKLQRIIEKMADLKEQIEAIGEQEQDAFDNASERVQDSDKGDAMQSAVQDLEAAASSIEEAMDSATAAQAAYGDTP